MFMVDFVSLADGFSDFLICLGFLELSFAVLFFLGLLCVHPGFIPDSTCSCEAGDLI